MPLFAATATGHPDLTLLVWVVLVAVGLVMLAAYLIACRIWPFRSCSRCEGSGKLRSPGGKAWRTCKRCKGSGGRLRFGRWVWNHISQTAREAKS